jgi:hypothetical protein
MYGYGGTLVNLFYSVQGYVHCTGVILCIAVAVCTVLSIVMSMPTQKRYVVYLELVVMPEAFIFIDSYF